MDKMDKEVRHAALFLVMIWSPLVEKVDDDISNQDTVVRLLGAVQLRIIA